ncbi:MAG: penicillin-binding protein 2, partial [Bdellovibrionota bacterium]
MKSRLILIFMVFVGLWTVLILRAAYLQFLPHERLTNLQNRQFQTIVNLEARRGPILDRQGRDLALSTTTYSLYADPKILEGKRNVARKLAKELDDTYEVILNKIKDPSRRFVWIQRWMPQEKMQKIKAMKIRGLSFVEEWRRVYPNDSLLAHTLGFMGNEGQGLEGVELAYNKDLLGDHKKIIVRRDARGRPLMAEGLLFTENPDGDEIKLTIDSELQYALENELSSAVKEFEAGSAYGIILDAKTSAIRAIATAPAFDLNKAQRVAPEIRRNRTITDSYEPGSTMKTFLIATALREKLIQPNTKFFCENGAMKVGDRIIREAEAREKFGWMTVTEILAVSSNIGSTKIAFEVGPEKLRQGLEDFGFGHKSGVDLPGEVRGTVLPLPWRQHLLANISFGHGVTASPLQIANAYAAIASGGTLHQPYIVESIRRHETGEVIETKPKVIRQVLTKEDAEKMRMILTAVTGKGGSGINARVNGFLVGGKTGTAQKVNPTGRGYIKGGYISSFGGFIPAHDPQFVIYVAIDEPKKGYYGAQLAAPMFSRIASYAVRREGIAPLILSEETSPQRGPAAAIAKLKNASLVKKTTLRTS